MQGGLSPKIVQTLAGHHDAAFTLQVYAKVRGGDMPSGDVLGLEARLGGFRDAISRIAATGPACARPLAISRRPVEITQSARAWTAVPADRITTSSTPDSRAWEQLHT